MFFHSVSCYVSITLDAYKKAKNSGASYLTPEICAMLEGLLDKAYAEYELGMDRASYGYWTERNKNKDQLVLFCDALTHFAAAQLYSQMVSTQLKSLAETP